MKPELISIFEAVSNASGIPISAIRGRRRTRVCVWARFAAAVLIWERFPWWSRGQIAQAIGRTDHGTAIHALNRAFVMCTVESDFCKFMVRCRNKMEEAAIQ